MSAETSSNGTNGIPHFRAGESGVEDLRHELQDRQKNGVQLTARVAEFSDSQTAKTVRPTPHRFGHIKLNVSRLSYDVNEAAVEWWQRLTSFQMPWKYCSKKNRKKKRILNEVTFEVESGQLLAVLGGSGGGKTTLLDCISGNAFGGEMDGNILLNNQKPTPKLVKKYAAYVRQNDRLLPHLTVKETLMFVARLKMPKEWKLSKINDKVDSVIQELGLRHVANSKVGGVDVRGISGGERRRVSIAVQLLLDPGLLILDEPTSGLDSFTAHHLIETLKRLSRNNRIVMLSIHQPRSDIFELFDVMLLLSQGQMVYFGPGAELVPYFTLAGYPCPDFTNPCDYYVDLITVDNKCEESASTTSQRLQELIDKYRSSARRLAENQPGTDPPDHNGHIHTSADHWHNGHVQNSNSQRLEMANGLVSSSGTSNGSSAYPDQRTTSSTQHLVSSVSMASFKSSSQDVVLGFEDTLDGPYEHVGLVMQFTILIRRAMANHLEEVSFLGVQAIEALCMSVMIGLVFYSLGLTQVSVRDRFALLYILAALYPYMVILDVCGQYHRERAIFYFEINDGLYSFTSYYFAKILSEIAEHTVFICLYSAPVYFMAGLQEDPEHFFISFALLYLLVYCSRCLGLFSAALLPTYQMSAFFSQALYTLLILSMGFIFNLDNIFVGVKWIAYVSYLKWGFQGLAINEFTGLNFTCTDLPNTSGCIDTGEEALQAYSIDDNDIWACALFIFSESLGFLGLFYFCMVFISQKPHEQ